MLGGQENLCKQLMTECLAASPALICLDKLTIDQKTAKSLLWNWCQTSESQAFIESITDEEALGLVHRLLTRKCIIALTTTNTSMLLTQVLDLAREQYPHFYLSWHINSHTFEQWLDETVILIETGHTGISLDMDPHQKEGEADSLLLDLGDSNDSRTNTPPIDPPFHKPSPNEKLILNDDGYDWTGSGLPPEDLRYSEGLPPEDLHYPEGLPPEDLHYPEGLPPESLDYSADAEDSQTRLNESHNEERMKRSEQRTGIDLLKGKSATYNEDLIDKELVQPGPLEHVLEKLQVITYCLYLCFGYSILYVINLIDNLWSLFSEYITRLYRGLMGLRTHLKVAAWRGAGELDSQVLRSVYQALSLTERHLCLPSYSQILNPDHQILLRLSTHNPLSMALTVRLELDGLRRELSMIKPKAVQKQFWKSVRSIIIDLVPNPINLLRPWVNLFIISFRLHYRRENINQTHHDLVNDIQELISILKAQDHSELSTSELTHLHKLLNQIEEKVSVLLIVVLQSRYHAQPHRWSLIDHLSDLNISKTVQRHPISHLLLKIKLLERIVKHQEYRSSSELLALEQSQSLLSIYQKIRRKGLI